MVGNSLGLNYEIPQVQGGGLLQPSQAEIAAQQPFQQANNVPMLPDINQDMAYKEGINDHLFNSYATLKRFAEDMNAKGIDVTKPDYSMPGGGDLYKTYKKLEADIYMTVDDLKRESDYEKEYRPKMFEDKIGMVQGVDPNTQFLSQMNPQDVFYNKNLFPEVEFANKQLAESLYTPQDVKRFNETYLYGPNSTMSKLKASLDNPNITPAQKAQIQFNIDALGKAAQQTKLYSPDTADGKNKRVDDSVVEEFTRFTNALYGTSGTNEKKLIDGKPISINKDLSNRVLGQTQVTVQGKPKSVPLTVKYTRTDPDGKRYIEYVQPEGIDEPIPDEEITGVKADALFARAIENNKRYGVNSTDFYRILRERGLSELSGESRDEALLAGVPQQPLSAEAEAIAAEEAKLNELFQSKGGKYIFDTTPLYTTLTTFGDGIELKKGVGGFYLQKDGKDIATKLNKKDIIPELRKQGYFDKFLKGQSLTEAPQNTTKASAYKTKSGIVVDYNKVQEVASKQGLTAEQYIAKHGLIAQ